MKTLIIFLISVICNLAVAKESLAILNAIEEYRNNNPGRAKSDIPAEKILTELIEKINTVPELGITVEEILSSLANVRESPSNDLVPKLKVIWSYYRKSTFRATYPDEWRYVKSLDSSQIICDEIKILIKKMGGNLDDIEPLDERITSDLNEVRILLKSIKDGSRENPLDDSELKSLSKKLSEIVKQCKFASSAKSVGVNGI